MARAYGTMTVSEITDIIDVYFEYSLAVNSATVTNSYAFNQVGELGWTVNGQSRKVPPTWVEGYRVWVREVKIKANVSEKIYGTPYPDTAVNEISNNLVEYLDSQGLTLDILNSKIRYMWKNLNNHTYAVGGWTKPDYPAGTYAASGKYNSISETYAIDYEDSSTYGFNTYLSNTALNLRYDNINMTTLSTSDLTFYYPKQINGAYVQGESGLKLSTNGLVLYNRGDGTEASRTAATLNTTGLILKEGGIKAGTAGQSGFIYLSTEPYGNYSINGSSGISDWKEIIGTKFGVSADGTLYASNAVISGQITVGSGSDLSAGLSNYSTTAQMNAAISTAANDASKIATNYLTFDETNGLDIGYTGKTEHTNIKADGMRIYDSTGSTEPVASFLSTGSTIGKAVDGESRTVTSNKGMRFYKRSGSDDITLAHIGYDQGVDADGNTNTYAPYYTFGKRNNRSAIGNYSMAEGFNTTASSYGSHAEGFGTTASGTYSHAEGTNTTASSDYSHAEGLSTTASSNGSHAEGFVTTASSNGSHAEGYHTTASGDYSHAEGDSTTASGPKSHAGGYCTVAGYSGQTVIGKYNSNKSNTAFEIGNGYDEDRSNALTVDWQGNVVASGSLTLNGDEAVADWVTEQGTKGSWKYRKWHSGKVEAWARWSVGTVAVTTASLPYGGYRSGELKFTIPSGIFTATPYAVGIKSYSQGGWLAHLTATSMTSITAYISCGASATLTNQAIDIYAWQN